VIDFTPQEKMSDTETDQENEIFFREDIQEREGFNTKDKHQEENNQSYLNKIQLNRPGQTPTHRTTQKHIEHHDATGI